MCFSAFFLILSILPNPTKRFFVLFALCYIFIIVFFHTIYLTSYILYMSRSLSLYLIYLISIYNPFFIIISCVAHIYIPFYILISRMPYRSHYLSASSLFYHTSCLCFFIFAFSLPIPYIFFYLLSYVTFLPCHYYCYLSFLLYGSRMYFLIFPGLCYIPWYLILMTYYYPVSPISSTSPSSNNVCRLWLSIFRFYFNLQTKLFILR